MTCHNYEEADQLARAITRVWTGGEKAAGYFRLTARDTRITYEPSERDFWITVEPAALVPNLSDEELAFLREFAARNGVQWKSKLRRMWHAGSDSGISRALRNRTSFNLAKFKFPEVKDATK